MYEKILVPLDGSELAERVIPYVKEIAKKLKSEVILLTVCMPNECMERPMRAYLEKRAEELQSLGIKTSQSVIEGKAASEILDFAQQNKIGLITISSHGRTGISRWAFGSVANKVLQRSHIPIILIRSKDLDAAISEKELKKILILLDGSQFAESIIPYVEGMDKELIEVILLRVIEPIKIPHMQSLELSLDNEGFEKDLMARAEKEVKRYLGKHESDLREKGVNVSSVSLYGKPAQTILQYLEDNPIDLIAMSTHGYSGITKWTFGSVASVILESSSKPILLIRPISGYQ